MTDLLMTKKNYDDIYSVGGGWCTMCDCWTDEGIDPNELGAICPQCGKKSILGAVAAQELGFISVKD